MDRNNTNFPVNLKKLIDSLDFKDDDWLRKNQRIVVSIFDKVDRGLLIYWLPGSGKTRLAIACALASEKDVIYIAKKSLMSDFNNKADKIKKTLKEKGLDYSKVDEFKHVTMNSSNLLKNLEKGDNPLESFTLNNKLIIIDEAHHMFNGVTNGAKMMVGLYEKIMFSKNSNILFLTGTPILKDPFEIVPCFNMLAGYKLLPENKDDFYNLFIVDNMLVNREKLENRLIGLISYSEIEMKDLPEKLPTKFIKCPMSEFQFKEYMRVRDKEIIQETQQQQKKGKKVSNSLRSPSYKNASLGSFRPGSRQQCNIGYEEKSFDISKVDFKNIKKRSNKCFLLGENIEKFYKEKKLQYVYSMYIGVGVGLISSYLNTLGWKHVNSDNLDKKEKKYAIISGEVSIEDREKYVSYYNRESNIEGDIVALLLVTITGSEGFDFMSSRVCHIFDFYWHDSSIQQIEARGRRLGSHRFLPKDKNNIITYIYLSTLPINQDSTDEYIYKTAMKRKKIITEFNDMMKNVPYKICAETNKKLFYEDIDEDMSYTNPCIAPVEKKMKVHEIIFQGEKFYYNDDFVIIIYDKETNTYKRMPINDPRYNLISNAISELQ